MTQEAALYQFFNGFDLPAYPNTAVPKSPELPHITYQAVSGYFGDRYSITVQIWYWTESETIPNRKVKEIGDAIGHGGIQIPCDGGCLWITRGTPWRISANAQDENSLKLRQLNVDVQFNITR